MKIFLFYDNEARYVCHFLWPLDEEPIIVEATKIDPKIERAEERIMRPAEH